MKWGKLGCIVAILLLSAAFSSCIHEYPVPVNSPNKGDPSLRIDASLDIRYKIPFDTISHRVNFDTRGRTDQHHHFVIELSDDKGLVCRDEVHLSDAEFFSEEDLLLGTLHHKLSSPLSNERYRIAVWYEQSDEDGNRSFSSEGLQSVTLINPTTAEHGISECGYISDILDLNGYTDSPATAVHKELDLIAPGARFEIIATDVNKFIEQQHEALMQGDAFKLKLSISRGGFMSLNAYTGSVNNLDMQPELSGNMRLPYAEYEELKIAEGFVFCNPEAEIDMKLSVVNTALSTVSQTDIFTFPVKRGHVTQVRGDFLTNTFEGLFNINHIWEGDIIIEE